jgi:hypothetical protein
MEQFNLQLQTHYPHLMNPEKPRILPVDTKHTHEKKKKSHPFIIGTLLGIATTVGYGAFDYISPYLPVLSITPESRGRLPQNQQRSLNQQRTFPLLELDIFSPPTFKEKFIYPQETKIVGFGDSYMAEYDESSQREMGSLPKQFVESINAKEGTQWEYISYAKSGATTDDMFAQLDTAVSDGVFDEDIYTEPWVDAGGNEIMQRIEQELTEAEFNQLINNPGDRDLFIKLKNAIDSGAQTHKDKLKLFLDKIDKVSETKNIQNVIVWYEPDLYNIENLYIQEKEDPYFIDNRLYFKIATKNISISDNPEAKKILGYIGQTLNDKTTEAIEYFQATDRHITITPFTYTIGEKGYTGIHPNYGYGYLSMIAQIEARTELDRTSNGVNSFQIRP